MPTYQELRAQAEQARQPVPQGGRPLVRVNLGTCSRVVGAEETLEAVRKELAERHVDADVMITGCLGLCYAEPVVEVAREGAPSVLYGKVTPDKAAELVENAVAKEGVASTLALAVLADEPLDGVRPLSSLEFFANQERRLMANCGVIEPENADHYIARGGYEGLARALTMTDEQVAQEVLDSGLWGRGGAAFPAGRKWGFLRTAPEGPKYLLCNADEGDPGSFVNRNLLESDPHLIIEGMAIAGQATGATFGFIYIRDEYPLPVERMENAVQQARERGILGDDVLGSGRSFDLEVVRGAGSYLCGEETGLIASIEGSRGMPRIRPPFPAQVGVFDESSNVNNVETFANVPLVLRNGAQWWSSVGSEKHKGTKMFSLSGQVQRVGILEVPLGTSMAEVVMGNGGGPPEGRKLKAVQPGGPLSGVIPAGEADIPLEPDPFRERGMFMGSGGLVIMDDSNCIVDLAIYFEWFAEDESCGRCTTCFAGTRRLLEILKRVTSGRARSSDPHIMRLLGDTMQYSNCVHGQAAPTAVMSMFRFFQDELDEHLYNKRCPTKTCRGLVRYEVVHHSDRLPAAEAICPTEAVVKEGANGHERYRIDQAKCIKCDACKEQAPYAIAVMDEFGPR